MKTMNKICVATTLVAALSTTALAQVNTQRIPGGTECGNATDISAQVVLLGQNTYDVILGDNLNPGQTGLDIQPDVRNDDCWIGLNSVANHSVWYKFNATGGQTYTITTNTGVNLFNEDTQVAVWDGCLGVASVIACNDNAEDPCDPSNLTAATSFTATASQTYYIQVDMLGDLQGKFGLLVYQNATQAAINDSPNNATSIQTAYNNLSSQDISNAGNFLYASAQYLPIAAVDNLDTTRTNALKPRPDIAGFVVPNGCDIHVTDFHFDMWYEYQYAGTDALLSVYNTRGDIPFAMQVFIEQLGGSLVYNATNKVFTGISYYDCSSPDGYGNPGGPNDYANGDFNEHPRVQIGPGMQVGDKVFIRVFQLDAISTDDNTTLPLSCQGFTQLVFERLSNNCIGPDGASRDNGTCLDTAQFTLTPNAANMDSLVLNFTGLSNAGMRGGLAQTQGGTNNPGGRQGEPGEFVVNDRSTLNYVNCDTLADTNVNGEQRFNNNNSAFYPFSVYEELRQVYTGDSILLLTSLDHDTRIVGCQSYTNHPFLPQPLCLPGEDFRFRTRPCYYANVGAGGNNIPWTDTVIVTNNGPVQCDTVSAPCGADVRFNFNNFDIHGTLGRTFEAFVVPLDSVGGFGSPISSYFGGSPADPCDTCYGMRSVNFYLPEGNYALVVDGDEGSLVEYDLEMSIEYFIPGTGISCDSYSSAPTQLPRMAQTALKNLSLFPNPGHEFTAVRIQSDFSGPAHYRVYDVRGKMVDSGTWKLEFGSNQKQLNVAHFESGLYMIEIAFRSETHQLKFMKHD